MSNINSCQISSERIDDVVLLVNVMKQMGLPEIINQHLPRHGNEKGLAGSLSYFTSGFGGERIGGNTILDSLIYKGIPRPCAMGGSKL